MTYWQMVGMGVAWIAAVGVVAVFIAVLIELEVRYDIPPWIIWGPIVLLLLFGVPAVVLWVR